MALSFLAELCISWKLWFPLQRSYPTVSALSNLDFSLETITTFTLSSILTIGLIFIALNRWKKVSTFVVLIVLVILLLEDITRSQPWILYQATIIGLIVFSNRRHQEKILGATLFLISLVYFWSGIQKINAGFMTEIFPWMLTSTGFHHEGIIKQENYLFLLPPLLEAGAGILLMITRTRKIAIFIGTAMHLFILFVLGPIGHNWNCVVWPWNLSLIALLFVFYDNTSPLIHLKQLKTSAIHMSVALLFGILPILNYFGKWDDSLSATMYSGTHSDVAFYFDKTCENNLSPSQASATTEEHDKNGVYRKSKTWLTYWSLYDLNVPDYPAYRYYKRIGSKLCALASNTSKAGLEITSRSKLTAVKSTEYCSCEQLLANFK